LAEVKRAESMRGRSAKNSFSTPLPPRLQGHSKPQKNKGFFSTAKFRQPFTLLSRAGPFQSGLMRCRVRLFSLPPWRARLQVPTGLRSVGYRAMFTDFCLVCTELPRRKKLKHLPKFKRTRAWRPQDRFKAVIKPAAVFGPRRLVTTTKELFTYSGVQLQTSWNSHQTFSTKQQKLQVIHTTIKYTKIYSQLGKPQDPRTNQGS
jgi:hypothetical protein